jgi:hypothetical protein
MRTIGWIVGGILVVGAIGCQKSAPPEGSPAPQAAASKQSAVERGKYLVETLGCDDCHTPKKMGPNGPEPDMTRRLSGHPENEKEGASPKPQNGWGIAVADDLTAWSGPWGISYTQNLTPDNNTGMGIWTEDIFMSAIRTGKHMGKDRPILPPMPWQDFSKLTDEDLKAIYAFLRTLPPVTNHVPDPIINAPPAPPAPRTP